MDGEFLKKIRKENNLTQAELADLLDVSRSIIAKIEGGDNSISEKMFEKLKLHLPMSVIDYKLHFEKKYRNVESYLNNHLQVSKEYEEKDIYNNLYRSIYFDYLKQQEMLIKVCQLLYYKTNRRFSKQEITNIFEVLAAIPESHIDNYSESSFKKFLEGKKELISELITSYFKEYFTNVTANNYILNFDFLEDTDV